MGNWVTCRALGEDAGFKMSNGTTAVFFDVVALAGSELAQTTWQRKLVYWLIQHDPPEVERKRVLELRQLLTRPER